MLTFTVCVVAFAFINPYYGIISKKKKQIASRKDPFRNGCTTPKTMTKAIPRFLVVSMSTKDAIVDEITVENE